MADLTGDVGAESVLTINGAHFQIGILPDKTLDFFCSESLKQ